MWFYHWSNKSIFLLPVLLLLLYPVVPFLAYMYLLWNRPREVDHPLQRSKSTRSTRWKCQSHHIKKLGQFMYCIWAILYYAEKRLSFLVQLFQRRNCVMCCWITTWIMRLVACLKSNLIPKIDDRAQDTAVIMKTEWVFASLLKHFF